MSDYLTDGNGRDLHKPVVKAAVRHIKTKNSDTIREHTNLIGFPLSEVFDTDVGIIEYNSNDDMIRGKFTIEGFSYVCDIELKNISHLNLSFANVSFGALDEQGNVDQRLQNWKVSPYAVLSGVLTCIKQKLMPIIDNLDAVVFIADVKNGKVDDRMRLYNGILTYINTLFRFKGDHQFENGSKIHIMHSIEDPTKLDTLMKFIEKITK